MCYRVEIPEEFPSQKMVERDCIEIPKDEDEEKYIAARKRDDWMCIVQCELYHFRNIELRNPDEDGTYEKILRYIRQANLDDF